MAYDVAAYIWPAYTGDETRTRIFWPEGMGEWQSVRSAESKYPGHEWPRKPLWGYVNEADPCVMQMEIEAAVSHGVNVFIYDWYWFDGRPFLENCLNDGFLKAQNCDKMKFYLMWANHDANTVWDKRLSWQEPNTVIWTGRINRAEFERAMSRVIDKYFFLPNYYTIDGKPVFLIYDVCNLVKGLGGVENTKSALEWMRDECVKRGLKGLHLQFNMVNERATKMTGVDGEQDLPASRFGAVGFDSATHYQFVHYTDIDRSYSDILPDVKKDLEQMEKTLDVPFIPHISVGWDNNPRFITRRKGVMRDCTPENIEAGFRLAKEWLDSHPSLPKLVTVNSWNEWTETSYLEPDDLHGYGYLEALKRVFG